MKGDQKMLKDCTYIQYKQDVRGRREDNKKTLGEVTCFL